MPKEKVAKSYNIHKLRRTRAAAFSEIYANHAQATPSFHDVRLLFGAIIIPYSPDAEDPYIEERVAVSMSWEHAKAVRDLLTRMINAYEEDHGPLRKRPKEELEERSIGLEDE